MDDDEPSGRLACFGGGCCTLKRELRTQPHARYLSALHRPSSSKPRQSILLVLPADLTSHPKRKDESHG